MNTSYINNYNNVLNAYSQNFSNRVIGDEVKAAVSLHTDSTQKTQKLQAPKECETCKKRKYQDQSDDPSVSFQTPQSIASSAVYGAVAAHESEHVRNEQVKAKAEGRKIVFQSVSIHTDVCPECGKMYISGGTTRTVTKADDTQLDSNKSNENLTTVTPGLLFDKAG